MFSRSISSSILVCKRVVVASRAPASTIVLSRNVPSAAEVTVTTTAKLDHNGYSVNRCGSLLSSSSSSSSSLRTLSSSFSSTSTVSSSDNNSTGTAIITVPPKPFRILGIQQIAIGCIEREPLNKLWTDVFGMKVHDTVTIQSENVTEDIVQLGPKPYTIEIDLMTPIDSNKSPKVHIPPLNHIGLWVDNLNQAVEWMTTYGKVRFTPGGIRAGASGHNVIFIHPKGNDTYPVSGNGVLIELVQAPDDIIKAYTSQQEQ